jgi:hypothetical protein
VNPNIQMNATMAFELGALEQKIILKKQQKQ